MAINNKKAFTLIEVLVAMLLFGIIITFSVKAYKFIVTSHTKNEIRYLALNKIDSEMNRLVFAYENFKETVFTFDDDDTAWSDVWSDSFSVPNIARWKEMKIYETNPLQNSYGLNIDGRWDIYRNTVEIVDNNNNPNIIDSGDIIGVMAWRVEHNPNETNPQSVHLSLSITYPYFARLKTFTYGEDETRLTNMDNIQVETLNLKTSTRVRQ